MPEGYWDSLKPKCPKLDAPVLHIEFSTDGYERWKWRYSRKDSTCRGVLPVVELVDRYQFPEPAPPRTTHGTPVYVSNLVPRDD